MKYISKDTIEIPSVTFIAPSIKEIDNDLLNETRRVAQEYKIRIIRDINIPMMLSLICCLIGAIICYFPNSNSAVNVAFGFATLLTVYACIDPISVYWSIKRRFIANYSPGKIWRKKEKIWKLYQNIFYSCNDMLFDPAILGQINKIWEDFVLNYYMSIKSEFKVLYSRSKKEIKFSPKDGFLLKEAGLRNPILFEPTGVLFRKEVKKPVLVLEKLSTETPLFVAKNDMTQRKEAFSGYCLLLVLPKKYKKKFKITA